MSLISTQYAAELRSKAQAAARLENEAASVFEQGTRARQRADQYVRETVILATVLLLTAISQRFTVLGVRVGLVAIAMVLLALAVYQILTFPRA